eukprot:gnl/TRDRNA2_/TRDRNA2_57715_c0_seq1.p1 gnl/TRDRNA2_/TRDRNA2_57715_c0~~gnl/TRDRNA2_/TRDRNA2_57715_c0_seq1.p1  ORF type:complete len:469 (-),score=133.74 gnl/TRDRNA2_/TRDRNA2_57715_c0_seq1:65-1471(-)
MSGCTSETTAVVVLCIAAAAALIGHIKLGTVNPVFDASAALKLKSFSQLSEAAARVVDGLAADDSMSQAAYHVLAQNAERWQGRPEAALAHEALGRMLAGSSNRDGALAEFQKAVEAFTIAEEAREHNSSKQAPFGLRDLLLQVRVQEAEQLVGRGEMAAAIEAVADQVMAEGSGGRTQAIRARSIKVLIAAALSMGPSEDDFASLTAVFERTRDSFSKRTEKVDPATLALLRETSAMLAEARGASHKAVDALREALALRTNAAELGTELRRSGDREAGDAAEAVRLAELHVRLAEALRERGQSGDAVDVEKHSNLALKLLWPTGGPADAVARREPPSGQLLVLGGQALRLLALGALERRNWDEALSFAEQALMLARAAEEPAKEPEKIAKGGSRWKEEVCGGARAVGAEALRRMGRGGEAVARGYSETAAAQLLDSTVLLGQRRGRFAALWPAGTPLPQDDAVQEQP